MMQQFTTLSISNKMIALIIVMTVIPFGFMVYSLTMERTREINEAISESAMHTEQTAKLISQVTGSTELLLNTLSRLPIVQAGDEKTVNSFLLDLVNQYPQYSSFFVVDKSGRRWATTNQMTGSVSYSDRKYFANAISSGKFSSGEYAIGKVKKTPVFSFGLPVRNSSGAITGVAVATLELSGIKDMLSMNRVEDRISVIVMDHKGKILLHSTRSELEGTQEYDTVFREIAQRSKEGTMETEREQGASRKLLAYNKLYLPGEVLPYMSVLVEMDKKLILNGPNRKFGLNLTILLALMIFSVVVVYRVTKRFMLDKVDESEQRHRALFETSPQGIVYHNMAGLVVSANPMAKKLFGDSYGERDAVIASCEYPLSIQEDGTPYPVNTHPGMEALSTGMAVQNRVMGVLRSSDDTAIWLRVNSIPMYRKDETKPYMVYSMFEDITEHKQAEAEKEKLEAQNRQLQKAESLGRMAGAIAHTFNNQLGAVIGNLEMAIDEQTPHAGKARRFLTAAMGAANKAAEVSGQMLTYLGQSFDKREPMDLAEACRRNLLILEAAIPGTVVLEKDLSSPGPAIIANAMEIQQVLTNLITNAWEAVGVGRGSIHLSVKTVSPADIPQSHRNPIGWQPQDSAYACLEVADTGDGIAGKDIEKIFDPFFSSKFTGRGLGLAIVLGIVKAHNGAITVSSAPGQGSTFRVFFPVSVEEVPRQPDKVAQPVAIAGKGQLLLVEDEGMLRDMATTMLTRLGFTVLAAKDGVEAVDMFRQYQNDICLVISDLTMPRMDGWETLTELRKLAPTIPVILASGYNETQVMAGDHPELPQVFLGKPYRLKELGDAIGQALVKKQ
jgi:two-component system cell cycle sensor histidine kinase/response regulator CckA